MKGTYDQALAQMGKGEVLIKDFNHSPILFVQRPYFSKSAKQTPIKLYMMSMISPLA